MGSTKKFYFLKSVSPTGEAHDGFVWPLKKGAIVRPTRWSSEPECGDGLHGFLNGEGDATLASKKPDAIWIVFSASEYVDLYGKAKVPEARVEFFGPREKAAAWIAKKCPGHTVIYLHATAGDYGTATAGDCGTATAGIGGTATAGHEGSATAGYRGSATAGNEGTATAGDGGQIRIPWHDGARFRLVVGYVGEASLRPGVAYKVENGKLVRA